ncbi:MAG TPA: hypothetical protein VF491_03975, partial [Vicinamibacterales bacterium]
NRDGEIIVGNSEGGVLRVHETGGVPANVTMLDQSRKEEFHLLPSFLPDGRHFVYLRVSPSTPDSSGTYVGSLDRKPDEQDMQRLMPYVIGLAYAPATGAGPGRLLFVREGTLVAQPFDPERLALAGNAIPVAERVGIFRDGAFFSASANDVLVYRTADTDSQLTWFDRQGTVSGRASEPGAFRAAALSPDGTRAVASRTDSQDPSKADLWLLDLNHGTAATRLTSGAGIAEFPVWSPDGARITYTFNNSFLNDKPANGEDGEKTLLQTFSAGGVVATGWSSDGRFLLYSASDISVRDLWVMPAGGRKPIPFLRTEFVEDQAVFSPTGRWVAYVANQTGGYEVYVRAFTSDFASGPAGTGASIRISRGGGTSPRWRGDGRELFYLAPDGKMMAAAVIPEPEFRVGTPTALFQAPPGTVVVDVASDGKRFLLVTPVGASASAPYTVVLNWTTELKK